MRLGWLLKKEATWGRHQLLPLLFVLIVLPGTFAYTALGFQHVLPTDTPVAVAPQNDEVTDDDLNIAVAGLTTFSDPVRYESRERAMRALDREGVYAVVTVPPRLTDEDANATFHLYTDGDMVPYREPSRAVASILSVSMRRALPSQVTVQRHEIGAQRTLSSYLVPTFLMMLVMVLALLYLPYTLVQEAQALDRMRFAASLDAVVAGKLLLFTVLLVVPLFTFQAASWVLGYGVSLLSPGSLLVYPLTFLYLGAFAAAVSVVSRFETWGRLVNVAVMLFLFTFSGLVYPVGFFSTIRRQVTRLIPTHYSMIVARGHALKGAGPVAYADMYAVIVASVVVAVALLKLSTVHYEWST